MSARPLAVVLGGDAVGLGVARSLHREGIAARAIALSGWDAVRFSRCARTSVVPASADLDAALLAALRGLRADPPPVLLPSSDFFAHFVARYGAELRARFRCLGPPRATVEIALDKGRDGAVLAPWGVPLPRTVVSFPPHPAELAEVLGLPLIIKPRTYVDKRELGWRNVVLHSLAHVEDFYRTQAAAIGRVIAQEIIPGEDTALWECIGVFDERSELVSAFTFRKRRTVPAHYGQTSYGVSESNGEVLALMGTIGKAMHMVGPADVDLKYDARDGTYKYLELNPRFGLCNYFATRCGVNPVADAYRLACGEPPAPPAAQRDGLTFLALLEDVGGRLYGGDPWTRVALGLAAALRTRPMGSYFEWRDPLPGPAAAARLAVRGLARALRGQLASVFTKDYGRRRALAAARSPAVCPDRPLSP